LLSTLSQHGILAAKSNYLWINIMVVAIVAVAAVAALVALKKS
jgi:flagellar basal body-associated protein FliL